MRRLFYLLLICLFLICAATVTAQNGVESPEDYFVEAFVTNTAPFVGEQIEYIFRFYAHQVPDNLFEELPDFEGFWVLDVDSPNELEVELRAGRQYFFGEYRVTLSPIRADIIIIDPADLVIPETVFQDGAVFSSNLIAISVQPLPPNAPYGFAGAVGQFHADISLDRTLLTLGQPITLAMVVTGAGNLESLPAPKWQFPEGWRLYTNPARYITHDVSGLRMGEKTFEWLVVPERTGSLSFPELQFIFFDSQIGDYQTIVEPSVTIDVLPGDDGLHELPVLGAPSGNEVGVLLLKPVSSNLRTADSGLGWGFGLLWIAAPLVAGICGIWIFGRRYQTYRRLTFRRSTALRRATKRLRRGRRNSPQETGAHITNVIYSYIADRLGHPVKRLKPPMIPGILAKYIPSHEVAQQITHCLNQAEGMRYMPKGVALDNERLIRQGLEALQQLDEYWIES
jgi:hypothetical protein